MVHTSQDECRHCGNNKHGSGDCRFERTLRLRLGNSRYFGRGACRRCGMSNHNTVECAIPGTKRVFTCLICGTGTHYTADHRPEEPIHPRKARKEEATPSRQDTLDELVAQVTATVARIKAHTDDYSTPPRRPNNSSPQPLRRKSPRRERGWCAWAYRDATPPRRNTSPQRIARPTPQQPTLTTDESGPYALLQQAQERIKTLNNRVHAAHHRANTAERHNHELRIRCGEIPRPRTPPPAEEPEYDV